MGTQSARPGFDYIASYLGQGAYNDATFYVNGVATPTTGCGRRRHGLRDQLHQHIARIRSRLLLGYKTTHTPHAAGLGRQSLQRQLRRTDAEHRHSRGLPDKHLHAGRHQGPELSSLPHRGRRGHRPYSGPAGSTRTDDEHDDCFFGDNGFYLGEHGLDDKRTLYEESLRIPMLAGYPRLIT